ncbi:MAG: sigma-70 family RNA polymerase sigma factor [Proteobacteria bacterium]|nr:sigma-70 family RNA polymerase sigma factor [Pseudomonadota bacterium]MBQ9244155.1 sigma-70 family RNA polymerase sigma factor [Pseudomonadota bacterium]
MTDSRRSFENDVLPYVQTLNGLAMKYTHNESEADDLVQEVLLRAYRSYGSYEPGTKCLAWLSCIMKNTFINRYRAHQREKAMLEGVTYEKQVHVGMTGSAEDALEADDVSKRGFIYAFSDELMQAYNSLSEDFRSIIMLADMLDFSYREISEKLKIPIGTVMSRLCRARQILRRNLEAYAFDYGYGAK